MQYNSHTEKHRHLFEIIIENQDDLFPISQEKISRILRYDVDEVVITSKIKVDKHQVIEAFQPLKNCDIKITFGSSPIKIEDHGLEVSIAKV